MRATLPGGNLIAIPDCYIQIMDKVIEQKILPDISDSKKASYSDENIIGRSTPLKTYSHSDARTVSWTLHLIACKQEDIEENLDTLRVIAAATYPQDGQPYAPPPICKIKCGMLLGDDELCAVLDSYSVKFPPDVAWDEETLLPYKFDIDMSFQVVYDSHDLPNSDSIWISGA